MSLLASLSTKKKISAVFRDGSSKQNLGLASVCELLDGVQDIPVQVSGDEPSASQLLKDLAAQANRKIVCAPLLSLPVAELISEPAVEPSEVSPPVNPPRPRTTRGDIHPSREPAFPRKYQTLAAIFFNGSTKGQILSVYRARVSNPQKLLDYKSALAAGDVHFGVKPLTKSLLDKLAEMGIDPEGD